MANPNWPLDPETYAKIALLVCGDVHEAPKYRTGTELTRFFENAGLPQFVHDGSTRRFWVENTLRSLSQDDFGKVLNRLTDRREYANDESLDRALVILDAALVPEGYPPLSQPSATQPAPTVANPVNPQSPAAEPESKSARSFGGEWWRQRTLPQWLFGAFVTGLIGWLIFYVADHAGMISGAVVSAVTPQHRHLSIAQRNALSNGVDEALGTNVASARATVYFLRDDGEAHRLANELGAALGDAGVHVEMRPLTDATTPPLWVGVTSQNGPLKYLSERITGILRSDGLRVSSMAWPSPDRRPDRLVVVVGRDQNV